MIEKALKENCRSASPQDSLEKGQIRETASSFSFGFVPYYCSYNFPSVPLKTILNGKIVRALALKTPFLETK